MDTCPDPDLDPDSASVDGLNSSSWNPRTGWNLRFPCQTLQTKFAPGNLRPVPEVNVTIPRSRSCRSLATNRSIPEWLEKKAAGIRGANQFSRLLGFALDPVLRPMSRLVLPHHVTV